MIVDHPCRKLMEGLLTTAFCYFRVSGHIPGAAAQIHGPSEVFDILHGDSVLASSLRLPSTASQCDTGTQYLMLCTSGRYLSLTQHGQHPDSSQKANLRHHSTCNLPKGWSLVNLDINDTRIAPQGRAVDPSHRGRKSTLIHALRSQLTRREPATGAIVE